MESARSFREIIGLIKDKVSLFKATLFSNATTLSLHLAILRSTTHSPYAPPDKRHLTAILSLGDMSRATASAVVVSLMDRLHRTRDSSVALKCLITIHTVIKRGPFILQDQFSIYPAGGGRNYLNLSAFRDGATAATWALSVWVRWYARYLETLLSTSRTLGFFLCSSSSTAQKDKQEARLSSFLNRDLIREIYSLVGLIEEICKIPDNLQVKENKLLHEMMGLIGSDHLFAVNEIMLRLSEFNERLSCLSFGESVELTCALKRIEDCRERLDNLFSVRKPSTETIWVLTGEVKEKVAAYNKEGGKMVKLGRREKGTESARLEERFPKRDNSVKFSSIRFGSGKFSLMVLGP